MALKQNTKKFKNISGETNLGGAPFFADDFIRLQQNASAELIGSFEYYRKKLPELLTWDGAGLSKQFENGLILSGLEYDNTDPNNPVVSEGFILSGGEVIYYPGATISAGANPRLLYLYKGAATFTTRVFDDGGTKDFLVEYPVITEVAEITGNGPELPAGTGITATDEVVVLEIGNTGSDPIGEKHFTIQAAIKIQGLAARAKQDEWTSAINLHASVSIGTGLGYMASRVTADGLTEIRGSVNLSSPPAGSVIAFRLNATNVNVSPFPLKPVDVNGRIYTCVIQSNGDVVISEPSGGWAATIEIYFNELIACNTTQPSTYEFEKNFLDIT